MIGKKFCFTVLEIVVMLTGIQAVYNDSVCSFETYTCGPIRPTFAESFIMKFELVDFVSKASWWEQEYFNEPNGFVKLKVVKNGIETHILFDYHLDEVTTYEVIHRGNTAEKNPTTIRNCKITYMEDSPFRDHYGYPVKHRDGKKRKMHTSNQKFYITSHYKYAFVRNVTLKDREIPTMQYHGCIYDEYDDCTIDRTYFWSQEKVRVASGDETIPAKLNAFGITTRYPNDDGVPVFKRFNSTENAAWYEGNPVFDPEIFQVPRGIYCKNFRTGTKKPKFPSAFSAHLEIASIKYDKDGNLKDISFVSNYEIWYDAEENLVRSDHMPGVDELDLFLIFGETRVSAIFDMNQGIVYYISKVSENCLSFEIPSNSAFTSRDFKRKLVSPEKIFGFDDDMQYKGKSSARDILCNVWNSQREHNNKTVLTEFYISIDDDWLTQSKEKDYDVPVRITKTVLEYIDDVQYETVTESNIFNFKSGKPQLSVFDITNCMVNQNHLFLSFAIEKNFKKLMLEKKTAFLQAVRRAIAYFSNIGSVLLVENVELLENSTTGNAIINFALMDQPILYGKAKKQPGTSLNSAFVNLKTAIDSGNFQILYAIDHTKDVEVIRPIPNSLIKLYQKSETPIQQTLMDNNNLQNGIEVQYDPKYDRKDAEQNTASIKYTKRYSSTTLVGLGLIMLIIGIGTGIVLMYLYLKEYGRPGEDSLIQMTERSN